jgi:hypothetical protein
VTVSERKSIIGETLEVGGGTRDPGTGTPEARAARAPSGTTPVRLDRASGAES